jgi:hypothetical protein
MLVAGFMAYAIFTLNEKRTYFFILTSVIAGIFLLYGPYQNSPVIYRIKTTFQGTKDPSALLRDYNRSRVQPYIQSHPIGGGLNTSGAEGWVYNDGHILSHFRPDSGYMKILAEQGWIGFAIQLLLYFLFLKKGLDGFYKARNTYIKNIYIALNVCLFALIVGQYSQVAIAQYPVTLFYYAALAIIQKLILYDTTSIAETNVT